MFGGELGRAQSEQTNLRANRKIEKSVTLEKVFTLSRSRLCEFFSRKSSHRYGGERKNIYYHNIKLSFISLRSTLLRSYFLISLTLSLTHNRISEVGSLLLVAIILNLMLIVQERKLRKEKKMPPTPPQPK